MGDMEITKREVLFSIIIVAVMFIFGLMIHGKITNHLMDEYQKYNTALQIENNSNLFQYGMKTNIGNAFIYGELKAVDTVTYPEIGGKYMYVEKVKERYTKHTEVYYTTDRKGHKHRHTRTYWSWDRVDSENIKCKEISFCEIKFQSNQIEFPNSEYVTTIKESSHIRYKYYGVNSKHKGTIFTYLENHNITGTAKFYENLSINETISYLESGYELIAFWSAWVVLTATIVFGFYYIDNRWLED